jgi:predicted deacylase
MSVKLAKVGSAVVRPGSISRGKLRVATYPDGREAFLQVDVVAGRRSGPTVLILTGAHGDEINGPEAVSRLRPELTPANVRGTVIIFPLVNPWGFAERVRNVPIDGRDLNRCYPGSANGSFSFQVANAILKVAMHAAVVIDVHDAGTRMVLWPHPRVHSEPKNDPTLELGRAFGSEIIMTRQAEPGMLAGEARALYGTTVVSVEVGGAMHVLEEFQTRALRGLRNLLRAVGSLQGKLMLPRNQYILHERRGVPAELSGIQTTWVELGEVVRKGQPLYRIQDPRTGRTVVRTSKSCGVVISKNIIGRVDRGENAISLLRFESCTADAEMSGAVIHNRAGEYVTIDPTRAAWKHAHPHLIS